MNKTELATSIADLIMYVSTALLRISKGLPSAEVVELLRVHFNEIGVAVAAGNHRALRHHLIDVMFVFVHQSHGSGSEYLADDVRNELLSGIALFKRVISQIEEVGYENALSLA